MVKLSSIATATQAWVTHPSGMMFLVERSDNPDFQRAVRDVMRAEPGKSLTEIEDINEKLMPAFTKYILIDWKNVDDDNGNPIPYTSEKGMEILNSREFLDLSRWLDNETQTVSHFKKEADKAAEKN